MNYYANTDIGRVRSKNQDQAMVIVNIKDQIVAVVWVAIALEKLLQG